MIASVLATLSAAAVGAEAGPEADWTETAKSWSFQSYKAGPEMVQEYTFTPNTEDKVVGASSVEVRMRVGADAPRAVELRLVPPEPLDVSQAEGVEVHLKLVKGKGLKGRNAFFCSPGFKKLTMPNWPAKPKLIEGGPWQRTVLDLVSASVLDKAKPKKPGEYDRRDVETICLNFTFPPGEVEAILLIDGLGPAKLPPPEVRREQQADGSFVIESDAYRVVIGANGYMQSLKAGVTEFLAPYTAPDAEAASATLSFVGDGTSGETIALAPPQPLGRDNVKAAGKDASIRYMFRKADFDIVFQQSLVDRGKYLYLALSPDATAALDGRTDRTLRARDGKFETGSQIHTRLMTRSGGVLATRQSQDGYARMGMALLPGQRWAFGLLVWGKGAQKFSLRPVGKPTAGDAVGFDVDCASPDFLLPGGKPVRFDITATNYAGEALKGRVRFQVADYLTREPVGERATPFELDAKQTLAVPTDVTIPEPGPYRGRVIVEADSGESRQVEWVFTYDFSNYKPKSTRQPDFSEFWQKQLDDLAKVPLDAKVAVEPGAGTPQAECYRISLAALDGRRVHGWYWAPRKPGKYPASFSLPPSGVHSRGPTAAPRGANQCGLWIQIQGLPVDFDVKNRPDDPAAFSYWTHGLASRETSMWRIVYTNLVRGVDFLCSRPEVDAKRIMISGGSQGGGLSIVLAGLDRRIAFSAPAHSGLCRLDWTVLHKPGFWPFQMSAKPEGQTTEQFLKTISYFDAASFAPDIACPVVAEVSLLDTVTASGNQICALAHVKPGLLQLICDPWTSHASMPRGSRLRSEAIGRWTAGQPPIKDPIKPAPK